MQVGPHDLRVDVKIVDPFIVVNRRIAGFPYPLDGDLLETRLVGQGRLRLGPDVLRGRFQSAGPPPRLFPG